MRASPFIVGAMLALLLASAASAAGSHAHSRHSVRQTRKCVLPARLGCELQPEDRETSRARR